MVHSSPWRGSYFTQRAITFSRSSCTLNYIYLFPRFRASSTQFVWCLTDAERTTGIPWYGKDRLDLFSYCTVGGKRKRERRQPNLRAVADLELEPVREGVPEVSVHLDRALEPVARLQRESRRFTLEAWLIYPLPSTSSPWPRYTIPSQKALQRAAHSLRRFSP